MKRLIIISLLLVALDGHAQQADNVFKLSVTEAVDIARMQSPDILAAKHSFRASAWSYRYFRANYLPSLSFTSDPYFNHAINSIPLPDGTMQYVRQNQFVVDGGLSLSQNIPLTGGRLSLNSSLQRMDMLGANSSRNYRSVPVTVTYEQSLSAYNGLKWDKRTEPLRFTQAKQTYVETLELVSANASRQFFNLVRAQTDLDIAKTNFANADTLYTIARGRYDIGTITENEMLGLEVRRLTEESNMLDAQIEVDDAMQELRSYLGITDDVIIEATIEDIIPDLTVDGDMALTLALESSPDITNMDLRLRDSEREVARAKSLSGLRADIFLQFGLTQTNRDMQKSYQDLLDQQSVRVGVQIPILDWGRGRGQVEVARSRNEMEQIRVDQEMNIFEQNIARIVKQFNQQASKVAIATKADATALHRNDVTLRLYMLGRATILDLNAATTEKDAAKRNYVNALSNYWTLYYTLRSLTLYDFEKQIPLTEDFELLLK